MTTLPSKCPSCEAEWTPIQVHIKPSALGCHKCFKVFKLNDDGTLTEQTVDKQRQACIDYASKTDITTPQ